MINFYIGKRAEGEEKDYTIINILYPDGKTERVKQPRNNHMHGGGDERLIKMLFSCVEIEDEFNQCAGSYDGFSSAMIGIGANESIKTGKVVDLTEKLNKLK